MIRKLQTIAVVAVSSLALIGFAGCASDADKASDNLSKAAEQFEVPRRIVGINGITDKVEFEVQGRCSLELGETMANTLDVICKEPDGTLSKHFVGLSDNMFFVSTQLKGIDVSTFRTRVIIKPQNIVPDLDLVTG